MADLHIQQPGGVTELPEEVPDWMQGEEEPEIVDPDSSGSDDAATTDPTVDPVPGDQYPSSEY